MRLLFLFLFSMSVAIGYAQIPTIDCKKITKYDDFVKITLPKVDTTQYQAFFTAVAKCYLKSKEHKRLMDSLRYNIPSEFIDDTPDLIYLALHSRSIETREERQNWFNLLPMMNIIQIEKLRKILFKETKKLNEIEQKYEDKKEEIKKKYFKKWQEMYGVNLEQKALILGKNTKNGEILLAYQDANKNWKNLKDTNKVCKNYDFVHILPNQIRKKEIDVSDELLKKYSDYFLKSVSNTFMWENMVKHDKTYAISWYSEQIRIFKYKPELDALLDVKFEDYLEAKEDKQRIREYENFYKSNYKFHDFEYQFSCDYRRKEDQEIRDYKSAAFVLEYLLLYETDNSCINCFEKFKKQEIQKLADYLSYTPTIEVVEVEKMVYALAAKYAKNKDIKDIAKQYYNIFDNALKQDNVKYVNEWYEWLNKQKFVHNKDLKALNIDLSKAPMTTLSVEEKEGAALEYYTYYVLNEMLHNPKYNTQNLLSIVNTAEESFNNKEKSYYGYIEKHTIRFLKNMLLPSNSNNDTATKTSDPDDRSLYEKSRKFKAYIIAIDKYQSKDWPKLNCPVSECRKLSKILNQQYGFEIDTLFNANATRDNIYAKLENIYNNIDANTNVLIVFSGHGFRNTTSQTSYIAPYDCTKSTSKMISYESLRDDILSNIFQKSKHLLLISDACFSGGIEMNGDVAEYQADIYDNKKSAEYLTAGGNETVADCSFVPVINDILKNNRNTTMTTRQLYDNTRLQIRTGQEPRNAPIKGMQGNDDGGKFVFRKR